MAYDFVDQALSGKTIVKTPSVSSVSKAVPTVKTTTVQPSIGRQVANLAVGTAPFTFRATTAGLGAMGKVLSTPLNAFGGFLQGTRKSAEKIAPQVKSGQKQLLPALAENVVSGIKNIPEGVKKDYTAGRYLTEDVLKTKSPIKKAGIQLATDLSVDPLNFAGAAFSKAIPLAKKGYEAAKVIPGVEKARDALGAFQYGYKVPANFMGKYEELQRKTSEAGKFAERVASPLKYGKDGKELPEATQRILGDILNIKGNPSLKAITPEEQKLINQYGPLADRTLKEFGKLAQEQIKLGADPAIFERLLGKYYGKRLYESKLNPELSLFGSSKKPRLDLSVYKKREDIPEEIRKAMGEVKTPAYGAALSAYAEKKNIATKQFFRWVAKKFVDKGENLIQLPKSDRLGPLSGRSVPKEIEQYINQIIESNPETLTEKITQFFKKGKTIYSPKQLARNVVTSQVQAFLNPSGRADSIRRLPEAIHQVRTKGKYFKELEKTGEIGGTFASELNKFAPEELSKFSGKKSLYKRIGDVGSNIQQKAEEVSKLQVYINERKAGKTVQEARKAAEETGFNYRKVSPLVSRLRSGKQKIGPLPFSIPFLTYPLKAAELVGKTLVKQPQRLTAIKKGEQAIQNLSQQQDNKNMPDYLKDSVQVTSPDKKGTAKYVNAKYMYPWGNLQEISPLPLGLTPDPIYQELVSQTTGKDAFTGKEFAKSPGVIGVAERARHAGETFLPTPFRSLTKLADAAMKNKRYATSPTFGMAIIQELGLPIYNYNTGEGATFSRIDKAAKQKSLRSTMTSFRKNYQGKMPDILYKPVLKYYNDQYLKLLKS